MRGKEREGGHARVVEREGWSAQVGGEEVCARGREGVQEGGRRRGSKGVQEGEGEGERARACKKEREEGRARGRGREGGHV